jgi:NADPH-dependent 2,4-dienoyl-CoA reductase/sulfur reductase-like enzyme
VAKRKKRINTCDAVVIGAGAAGMAAACAVAARGHRVAVVEREEQPGGILMQCIHNGFGLHHFHRELTGPEYAEEYIEQMSALPVDFYPNTTVVDIQCAKKHTKVIGYSAQYGVLTLKTTAVVCAMGCRERNRGNIATPGSRPSGVFTAGLAQRLLNIDGYIPGKKAVIIGSGDIGLIMARRLRWTGVSVECVVEILPYPSGLTRNIVQCLKDFSIPLYLSHAVTSINGAQRVESVDITPLENGVEQTQKQFRVACDTVLLSVGLIPENELSRKAGIVLNPNTGGPIVDHTLQTNVPGIFACGNVLHVHDLVDFVSDEATRCGENVAEYCEGKPHTEGVEVRAGANCRYVVPQRCARRGASHFFMRTLVVSDKATVELRQGKKTIFRRSVTFIRPAEMISITLSAEQSRSIVKDRPLEFSILPAGYSRK